MQILTGLEGLKQLPPGTALSVGNFDGVHLGHRRILGTARELNERDKGAGVAVVTFEPHPLTVLRPTIAPPRLTPVGMKRQLLEDGGVDYLVELPPGREVLDLSAEAFWALLRDQVRPWHMIEGGTFNFGKDRRGTIERLREWASQSQIQLHIAPSVSVALLNLSVVAVNSSLIRWLLGHGRVRDAAICLGRAYALEGEVVQGHRRGHAIGVPTANLKVHDQMVPLDGVYSGRTGVDGRSYAAAISIGTTPTFDERQFQIEVHLIDFHGDLYGKHLRVEIIDWLREQRRFGGVEPLKSQLKMDIAAAMRDREHDSSVAIANL